MIQPVPRFVCVPFPTHDPSAGLPHDKAQCGPVFECGKWMMAGCLFLSFVLHGLSGWLFEFRPVQELVMDRLLLLDIVTPRKVAVSTPIQTVVSEAATPVEAPPAVAPVAQRPVRPPVPQVSAIKKNTTAPAVHSKPAHEAVAAKPVVKDEQPASLEAAAPVGQVTPQKGVTVLANESGQDALKHGSEARFMHGVATEEFVEENYIGEYSLGKLGRVWIEDDRARSGHLILHVEGLGLTRPLFRFNRFIYVYGENPDSPEPILGSVTFFSDGDRIHQFLMQHNSTHAYFPRRN